MFHHPVLPGVSVASISAANVTVAAGRGGEKGMHMMIVVIIVIAAVAGVVYFMRKRSNRPAPMNAEDGSDSWTRPPPGT
jgi:flagellar basal body-associated protein FliL